MRFPNDPLLTIGHVAQRSGVQASALRFYETRGLISSVRADSGHRRFPRSTLRRIAFIVFAQKVGFTLDEIATQLARLPTDHVPTGEDWRVLTGEWKARVQQRIEELQRLNIGLDQCIGCGCLSIERCMLSNPGDRGGGHGAGARRWTGEMEAE